MRPTSLLIVAMPAGFALLIAPGFVASVALAAIVVTFGSRWFIRKSVRGVRR